MFFGLDALVEGFRGIVREDRDACLEDDGAGVHAAIDVVDGAAGLGGTGEDGLFPGFEARESGEERGVDVEDAVGEGVEEG